MSETATQRMCRYPGCDRPAEPGEPGAGRPAEANQVWPLFSE